jgi:hypothetical protein
LERLGESEASMLEVSRCWIRGCKHYDGVDQPDGTEASERHICSAFPNGIPDEIAYGDELHLDSWPSEEDPQDNDIQFERDFELTDEELVERRMYPIDLDDNPEA